MIEVSYQSQLYNIEDAILNEEYHGFREDYLVLHSLIRKFKPNSFFEVGTNMGTGTNIICNAMSCNWVMEKMAKLLPWQIANTEDNRAFVYSLDLPSELAHISLQHPISEGKGDKVGSVCKFPFTQLRGDSLIFDYEKYPCDGYFVDGEHDFAHPYKETKEIIKLNPKIIIWHDADIPEVFSAISSALMDSDYQLFRVTDTRIAYTLKK